MDVRVVTWRRAGGQVVIVVGLGICGIFAVLRGSGVCGVIAGFSFGTGRDSVGGGCCNGGFGP